MIANDTNGVREMDYYDQIAVERGEREALAIAVDDARKLRRHLCLIRLIAAAAAAIELVRQGRKPPERSSWRFEQGWAALLEEMRGSYSAQVSNAAETVHLIARGDVSWREANEYIWRARCLRDLLQHGFIPPDPAPSEDYARGWEAACAAFAESDELDWLAEALADAEEACDHARCQAQGRAE
jgi:hypothetical protein